MNAVRQTGPRHFNLSEKRLFRCRPVSPSAVIAPAGGAGHRSGHKLRVETLVKPVHRPVQMRPGGAAGGRSEEHTSELQSLMRISYAVFCLIKKKKTHRYT